MPTNEASTTEKKCSVLLYAHLQFLKTLAKMLAELVESENKNERTDEGISHMEISGFDPDILRNMLVMFMEEKLQKMS